MPKNPFPVLLTAQTGSTASPGRTVTTVNSVPKGSCSRGNDTGAHPGGKRSSLVLWRQQQPWREQQTLLGGEMEHTGAMETPAGDEDQNSHKRRLGKLC